jgi:hypothetical protein
MPSAVRLDLTQMAQKPLFDARLPSLFSQLSLIFYHVMVGSCRQSELAYRGDLYTLPDLLSDL